ncbi:hypothetical protein IYX23_02960 [Methylocystis sp. L43]|uniref:hypothetical protein n=1 Tax=unclassified Methylocystis TaxID=2625913 RepID=UPI0018C2FE0D|nr:MULTISPECIES: hypothetical protein [unclassified Methylocystis]MBG0796657.1 hypothetical protein [Methylocystis sp. L43]MBG0804624.1 hypothetical protein [Methylocystis sp. H15]
MTTRTAKGTPTLVELIAKRLPPSDVVDRLLSDPRMNAAWRELLRQRANDKLVDAHLIWLERDTPLGLTRDDLSKHSRAECAAAALFVNAVAALTKSPSLKTRAEHDAKASKLAEAAALCREQRQHAAGDLKQALAIVADHFNFQAELIEANGDDPHIIERRVGDDATRVQARMVAAWSFAFYGRRNLGTVATISSVATATETSKQQVVKWTARPSH